MMGCNQKLESGERNEKGISLCSLTSIEEMVKDDERWEREVKKSNSTGVNQVRERVRESRTVSKEGEMMIMIIECLESRNDECND